MRRGHIQTLYCIVLCGMLTALAIAICQTCGASQNTTRVVALLIMSPIILVFGLGVLMLVVGGAIMGIIWILAKTKLIEDPYRPDVEREEVERDLGLRE